MLAQLTLSMFSFNGIWVYWVEQYLLVLSYDKFLKDFLWVPWNFFEDIFGLILLKVVLFIPVPPQLQKSFKKAK